MDGKTLRLRRITADVKAKDLADAIGVPAAQVSRWENSRLLTDEATARYLAGLAKCATNTTSGETPAEVA